MKILLSLVLTLTAFTCFAGGETSVTYTCDNGTYAARIKVKGSFFGKNQMTVKESKVFGKTLVDEAYEQDWSPTGEFDVEALAKKELPCSNEGFYTLQVSESAVALMSFARYSECPKERDTYYIQLKNSKQVIKFDMPTQCTRKQN